MRRQRREDGGKQAKTLRETQGLGCGVEGTSRLRQIDGARGEVFDEIAGERFGRSDQPQHDKADRAGSAGRPLRQTGERAKQRREAVQPLSSFRDGGVVAHAGFRWSSTQCAGWRRGVD
ncbi:MAG: hypothetical protein ACXIVF_18910 [Rhizobiaceae bacterium]